MTYRRLDTTFGRAARNRLDHITDPGPQGARSALETFYFAFNRGDIDTFRQVWVEHELIRLKNPLGGVMEGIESITALYDRIFNGAATVWVEFHDIVAYELDGAAVFSGRERGEFATDSDTVALDIRTTRVFHFVDGRWGQLHHHGSITDTEMLQTYREAVQK
jgi:limonene-1,2-epoxide hydrolase